MAGFDEDQRVYLEGSFSRIAGLTDARFDDIETRLIDLNLVVVGLRDRLDRMAEDRRPARLE